MHLHRYLLTCGKQQHASATKYISPLEPFPSPPSEGQSPRARAKLLCSDTIIKGSVDFALKCV